MRRCRFCREHNIPKEAPKFKFVCGVECSIGYARKMVERKRAKEQKAEKKVHVRQKRAFYDKDIKTRREAAVYWFNRYIRLRDAGSPCISCGNSNPNIKYDAGHYIAAGTCASLRFDEQNVNVQCSNSCNVHLSGNGTKYREGIIRKWGIETLDRLEGPQPTIKITVAWYKDIEEKYKKLCKQIQSSKEA
jgi:hypothetical protein